MNEQGATLRAQWLGQQLREMREQARLTLKDVGEYVSRNASTVSRMESGLVPARVPEVLAYLDVCGVDDPQRRDALRTMARDAWQKGWWDGFVGDVTGHLIDRIWLESRAVEIHAFETTVLPGLLQTRGYADALIRTAHLDATPAQVNRYVEARMARQQILHGDTPVRFSAVVEEGVVNRMVGGDRVMVTQLRRLHELAGSDHITLQVLGGDTGAHASPDGTFDLFQMAAPYPDAACLTTPAGSIIVESAAADRLAQVYDRLRKQAMPPDETREFLGELIECLE